VRRAAIAACALLALSVVLTPWYALDDYVPNGWDATWWARAAAVAAIAAIVALRFHRDREAAALAGIGLACVIFRTIDPPDFGFAFDGLDVPTARRWGVWVALAAAAAAAALVTRILVRRG
jgi:lipopolysaccharide export LptBFGC system permease protein LptF